MDWIFFKILQIVALAYILLIIINEDKLIVVIIGDFMIIVWPSWIKQIGKLLMKVLGQFGYIGYCYKMDLLI